MRLPRFACPVFLCALLACASVGVRADTPDRQARRLEFAIPALPLADALHAYGLATGLDVFFDWETVEGRFSSAVVGRFTPEEAVELLLGGSGLEVRRVTPSAFTVAAAANAERPAPSSPDTEEAAPTATTVHPPEEELRRESYFAAVQASVERALCEHPATSPGPYQAAVRIWIADDGEISRSELLGSTGERQRDAALHSALRGLLVDERPPRNLPQPVTFLVDPRPLELVSERCAFKLAGGW